MSVEFYRESPRKFDSRTLNMTTLNRWTGRTSNVRQVMCLSLYLSLSLSLYIHIYTCVYMYVYMYIYIYICMYMCMCVYIYIYIQSHRRHNGPARAAGSLFPRQAPRSNISYVVSQYSIVQYSIVQYSIVQYSIVQHMIRYLNTTVYYSIWFDMISYHIILYYIRPASGLTSLCYCRCCMCRCVVCQF